MNKATLYAHIGEKAILKYNGEYLSGEWEVTLLGMYANGKAKVLWQKPAMPDLGFGAKPADSRPTEHAVILGALQLKEKPVAKVAKKPTKAKVAKKVTTPTKEDVRKDCDLIEVVARLCKAGLKPEDAVKAAKAIMA